MIQKIFEFAVSLLGPGPILALMAIGCILLLCELFVEATPNKDDDAKWKAIKSGYLGPFINFLINLFKNRIVGYIKK